MVEGEVAELEGPLEPVFPEEMEAMEEEEEDEKADKPKKNEKIDEPVDQDDEGEAVEPGYTPGEVTVVQYCEECGSKARFTARWSSWRAFCGGPCETAFRKKIDAKVTNPGLDSIPYAKVDFPGILFLLVI